MLRLLVALCVPYVATQGVLRWVGCSYLVRLLFSPPTDARPARATTHAAVELYADFKLHLIFVEAQVVSACYRFSYLSALCFVVACWIAGRIQHAVAQLQASIYNERYLVGSALRDNNLNGGSVRPAPTAKGQ